MVGSHVSLSLWWGDCMWFFELYLVGRPWRTGLLLLLLLLFEKMLMRGMVPEAKPTDTNL